MTPPLPPHYRQRERAVRDHADSEARWARPRNESTLFHGDDFTIALQTDWGNETVYVLEGPEEDNFLHTIQINVDPGMGDLSVPHYADVKIEGQTRSLRGCVLLTKGWMRLDSGRRAYRALLAWSPMEDRRLYQDQLYVVHEGTAYQLSASFTRKTLKTIGPRVDQVFRRFEPHASFCVRGT